MIRNRRGVFGSVILLSLLCSGANAAVASRVVILRGPADDSLTEQGNTLLAAELRAAGFEVTLVMRDPSRDIRRDIENSSAQLAPIATFAIRPAPDGAAVELWLEDRVTGKVVIRRIVVDRSREGAADLAVRAVELLRGSLVEVILPTTAGGAGTSIRDAPPADVARWVSTAVRARPAYFSIGPGIAAGATAIATVGLGTTFTPAVLLSWGTDRGWVARLSLAALGQAHEVRRPEGIAHVSQGVLLIEGARVFRPMARFQPFVAGGAGFRRLRIDGMGTSSLFPGATGVAFALAATVGGGLALRLGDRVALVCDAGLLLVVPSTNVVIASNDAARAGPWVMMGTLTAAATF